MPRSTSGRRDVPRVGRRRNELKVLVLNHLSKIEETTSRQLHKDLSLSIGSARTILSKLKKMKLVDHEKKKRIPGPNYYIYFINKRGLERIEYWKNLA